MIKIGEYNSLEVIKETNFGFYLGEKDGNEEILIPKGNIIDTLEVGDIKKFFVYRVSAHFVSLMFLFLLNRSG